MEQSVPNRRHIKFRRQGIIQKKGYSIHNTAKVWNPGPYNCLLSPGMVRLIKQRGLKLNVQFECKVERKGRDGCWYMRNCVRKCHVTIQRERRKVDFRKMSCEEMNLMKMFQSRSYFHGFSEDGDNTSGNKGKNCTNVRKTANCSALYHWTSLSDHLPVQYVMLWC